MTSGVGTAGFCRNRLCVDGVLFPEEISESPGEGSKDQGEVIAFAGLMGLLGVGIVWLLAGGAEADRGLSSPLLLALSCCWQAERKLRGPWWSA